ncbi:MAG: phosphohistidine phosphatase SixA [Deltaproteobacteria bacterium]|nr:MAG: phosphohistidine phosphatase SixA [Deltaproteobacteria bacterium]
MIRVFLVRHGIAADAAPGQPDESRPLTAKGRRRFRRTARAFARLGERVDKLITSPLVRAVQTAEILARALRQDEVGVLEELRSEVPPAKLFGALSQQIEDGEGVALVGHDPQMTKLVAALAQLDGNDADRIAFAKGGIVRIDVDAFPPAKNKPRWHLEPRAESAEEGLPLLEHPHGQDDHR